MDKTPKLVLLTNKIEPEDFNQNMVNDENAFLLIVFQSDTIFSYDGNKYFKIPANTAIIYKPNTLTCFKNNKGPFLNSFMYIYADESYFKNYSLLFNTLIVLNKEDAEFIVFEMDRISYIINTPYAQSFVCDIPIYLERILKTLTSACVNLSKNVSTPSLRTSFINIRGMMYSNPTEITVKRMADTIGFSETYFGIKYKDFFGITPSQDRKNKIVDVIKKYLLETDYSLEVIADFCNIKNVAHLINIFKSVEQITPHQFRKNNRD